jgi:hypothetical protein
MKTFEQLVQESLQKKPYELFKGPFLYFNQEGTALKIKDGIITDVIGAIPWHALEKYFPNGRLKVLALLGRYLQYLFPDDEDARKLTDKEYASWYIIRIEQLDNRNVNPKFVRMGRKAEWLSSATIDLGYEGWNLDKDVKDAWRTAMKHL